MLFKLIKKVSVIFIFKKDKVFVVASVVQMIRGIRVNLHM
jgi:hypothetical protein